MLGRTVTCEAGPRAESKRKNNSSERTMTTVVTASRSFKGHLLRLGRGSGAVKLLSSHAYLPASLMPCSHLLMF